MAASAADAPLSTISLIHFMSKPNLAYALASQPLVFLTFSGNPGTTSQYLTGPGGIAADGIPIPFAGTLSSLTVFDGTNTHTDTDKVTFTANNRISVFAQNVGGTFTIRVRVNGVTTSLQTASVPLSTTLQATVAFAINRV